MAMGVDQKVLWLEISVQYQIEVTEWYGIQHLVHVALQQMENIDTNKIKSLKMTTKVELNDIWLP